MRTRILFPDLMPVRMLPTEGLRKSRGRSQHRGMDAVSNSIYRYVVAILFGVTIAVHLRGHRLHWGTTVQNTQKVAELETETIPFSGRVAKEKRLTDDTAPTICGGRRCKVAVVACVSSRNVVDVIFHDMALVKLMLPSLMRTVETNRFQYAIYIGIDGEPLTKLFDSVVFFELGSFLTFLPTTPPLFCRGR